MVVKKHKIPVLKWKSFRIIKAHLLFICSYFARAAVHVLHFKIILTYLMLLRGDGPRYEINRFNAFPFKATPLYTSFPFIGPTYLLIGHIYDIPSQWHHKIQE